MNPDSMEVKSTMFLPNSTIATGQLCPDQRRMPQIGSLFAEMFAMVFLAIRLPIVVVVSAPVILDLLTGPCYLDSKSHSLLMNCGQEIFSLDEFFKSAYACNGHFWRILAKAGNFLTPGFTQTFINGMTAVGENSAASAFMPGLIGAFSKVSENNPTDTLSSVEDLTAGGSRFGPMSMFMKTALNPIAGAHWMWRMGARIIVQCIQAAKEQRSVASVFWNVIYEGRVDYKELVATRMFNTCGGLALMAGYFTPMGNMVLHYCFAGVKSTTATLDLISVFMVDLPVIVCICKQTTGENPANWIVSHCDSPDGLKPMLRRIMDNPDICGTLVSTTNANLTGVYDDVFGELFTGTSSVGSVLDSFVAAVDPEKAGQCDNYETNPYVVTLIPEPADYWRVCGNTDFCRLRCQQQMEAFEAVRPSAAVRSVTTVQTVQSLLFPTLNADAYNPFTAGGVVALTELRDCTSLCIDAEDRCFLMAGFAGSGKLSVSQYCVPSALARGVSKAGSWDTLGISGLSTIIQVVKSTVPGAWRDTYCIVGMQDQLLQACARLTCAEFKPSDVDLNALGFEKIQSLDDVIVLQLRMRKGDVSSFCLRFNGKWKFSACSSSNLWDQSMYHVVVSFVQDQVLLLPYDDVPLKVCNIDRYSIRLDNCQAYSGFNRQNVPVKSKGLQSRVSQSTKLEYSVFVASNDPSHWLTMLYVDTTGTQVTTSVANSISVSLRYTLQQGCSLDSCIGCTQLSVQRLCFAAQRCQVARCIGSQVNQIRPLCAIGGTVEATMFAMLATVQGVWTVLSSALSAILDISGGIDPPKVIKWPDQVFYGLICSLKDAIASQISILTSMINGLMQASMPVIDQAMGETVDNQFLATFTLTMTAVTKFLFQLCLAPLYAAIAAQKVVLCQANSLVAVASGNTVSIGDPGIQTASSAAAGACMTQFSTENAQGTNSGVDNGRAFTSASMDIITQLSGVAMSLPLDAIRHPIDVVFTYALGVVRGLQDILQTTDQRNCRAPDWTTRVLYKCPCGDQPVAIPAERLSETYLDGAFWCSTVMSLLNFDGSVKYVWNPFSLQQLKTKLGSFDTYLECVASKNNGDCIAPTDEIFKQQQIPMISVYQRCLSNYQEMTWDQGTHVLFNRTLQRTVKLNNVIPEVQDTHNVSVKLLEAKAKGFDNTAVLDMFLGGSLPGDYFKYSNITTTSPGSADIDACLTFSGPAKIADKSISQPFTACLESYANRSGCDIPHMLWSGRSTNKVPVATQHTLTITDPAVRLKMANGEMEATQSNVLAILDKLQKEWTGDGLKITIFSADGDLLHQYADCVMQGPLGSMTLTPGPDSTEKVIWSRSSDGTPSRLFEIPCSGERLTNRDGITRDDVPPFTCGSHARRAVVKHFLRVTYGGEKENGGAKASVVKEVLALLNRTREAWTFKTNFMCTCPNSTNTGWECCEAQKECATEPCPCPGGYSVKASVACCKSVCGGLAGSGIMEPFSKIKGEKLADDLLASVGAYMKNDIWTSTDPWLKFDPKGAESYQTSWQAAQFEVADSGLFDASNPIVYYDEITYPFKSSFWEHCAGLLQQVIWTMPLDRATGRPKIPTTAYDPVTGKSQTPNITYTEEFIQLLTKEAYKSSPLYWHYNIRHSPSTSEICRRKSSRMPPKDSNSFTVGNNSARAMGFSSMTLGGLGGADCMCGWWFSSTECKIPDVLCVALVQILGFGRICSDQKQIYNSLTDHRTVLEAVIALKSKQPDFQYPCPALQISEHWGLMDASTGNPFTNTTDTILKEGVGGFRVGNIDWLFMSQATIINPDARVNQIETPVSSAAIECNTTFGTIVDHFIDDLFPSATGVRQSLPQSYCTRYGIELARLTAYAMANLISAASEQQGVVAKWRKRCQFKLEELAVCNSFKVLEATGGPTKTAQCPFTLSVIASLSTSYAVTPGCLLVLWNTPGHNQDGIYDPCICVSCANTPNVDVPAQLTSLCKLESFQTLVSKDVIPTETPTTGVPLGSGSFRTLMDKPGFLQINTPDMTHWALHSNIRDADLVLDWWPEEWKHPVGFHVTPACSRVNDAHWRTFDTSWRWDLLEEEMHFARDETNDPMKSRNSFGGSGVCRTNNYGMPMTTINTMAVCTKENTNANADPMVPSLKTQPTWVDGKENCAADCTSTPWEVDMTINPPRQWTVGTLHTPIENTKLRPLSVSEWGPDCGPHALHTCQTSNDCASGLTCLRSSNSNNGVCGLMQERVFDCTSHIQCPGDRMCAGDGICVDGVWHIRNDVSEPFAFRTYSQDCSTGVGLDTWGTSIAEGVPDILNASGLCSYRSWFENRRMAQRNGCTQSDTCSDFSGLQKWNFTSPRKKGIVGESAFDSNVLKIKTHVCDRDYQYMDGFVSCTPNQNFYRMYQADNGNSMPVGSPTQTDNRTRTYRAGEDLKLPLIHHMDNAEGPTYGFTGIPLTYAQLGLGKSNPSIKPCSSLHICGFQPSFKVNGISISQRLVLDNGKPRGYIMQDLLQCGAFGYLSTNENGLCRIDFAVAPLAGLILTQKSYLLDSSEYSSIAELKEAYPPDSTSKVITMLTVIPELIVTNMIGGKPTSLQDYADKSAIFVDIHNSLANLDKPVYMESSAGIPRQIYKLTQYGAYEVPFIWWYKCVWIGGFSIAAKNPVSSSQCSWRDSGDVSQPTIFGAYDNRIAELMGLPKLPTSLAKNTTLQTLLMKLPGIVTRKIIETAKVDYINKRDGWIDSITTLISNVKKLCYTRKEFDAEYTMISERYQAQILSQMYDEIPFDLKSPYLAADNRTIVCKGDSCLKSTDYSIPTGTNSDFSARLSTILKSANVAVNSIPMRTVIPDGDNVALKTLFTSDTLPPQFWSDISNVYQNQSSGCDEIMTLMTENIPLTCLCSVWKSCSISVQTQILHKARLNILPSDRDPAQIDFGQNRKIDVCDLLLADTAGEGVCALNDNTTLPGALDQTTITSMQLPIGTSIEIYDEVRWDCVRLTCDSRSPDFNNKMVPASFNAWTSRTVEKVVIDEYEYTQMIPTGNSDTQWKNSASEDSDTKCDVSTTRFQNVKEEIYDTVSRGLMYVLKCRERGCSIPERVVAPPYTRQFKIIKAAYFVNDTLIDEVQSFPYLSTEHATDAMCVEILNNMINMHPHRYELRTLDLKPFEPMLNSYQLPNEKMFILAYTRDSKNRNAEGVEKLKATLAAINTVIKTINTDFIDEACATLSKSCAKTILNVDAKLTIGDMQKISAKRSAMCQGIKSDPIYGCNLWPGEATAKSKDSAQYSCKPLDEYNTFTPNRTCMQDLPNDPCTSPFEAYRKSNTKGRTLVYELGITTPSCVKSPIKQCTLADEKPTLASASNKNAGCPGTNSTDARYKAYSALRNFKKLYTEVMKTQSFTSQSATSASGTGLAFDHMFIKLNQDFTCRDTSAYRCPDPLQIPVQIRRRLWKCFNCPLVSSWQCKGQHNCVMQSPKLPFNKISTLEGWKGLTPASKSFLIDTDSDISAVIPAIAWIVARISSLSLPDVRLSYDKVDFMSTYNQPLTYTFNPIPILAYEDAMQRNAKTCTLTGIIRDFTNCSYDGHRRDLVRFINNNYKISDGIVIQPGDTLQWQMSRTQLTSHNIPQWNAIDGKQGLFLSELLSDSRCRNGSVMDNACYTHSDNNGSMIVDVLNPSMFGSFEPLIGCDTEIVSSQRVISAMCSDCSQVPVDEYLQIEDSEAMTCPSSYQGSQGVTIDDKAESNLCSKTPTYDSKCTNKQGMLSQSVYDGNPASDIYTRKTAVLDRFLPPGIRENMMFKGVSPGNGKVSNLVLNPDDIGGHSIRMVLGPTRSGGYSLDITGLPLSSYASSLSDEAFSLSSASANTEWVDTDLYAEVDVMRTLYPSPRCSAWDCPLRRRAFYMGDNAAFRPLVPDPLRTQILYGTQAHPTQKAFVMPQTLSQSTTSRVLGAYTTANGFCACSDPANCVAKCQTDEVALSGEWTDAVVQPNTAACSEQLDWPYAGGTLRDGTEINRRWTTTAECGVLDRLPVFKYRYKNIQKTKPSSKTTLDKGGACHMGWPVMTAGPLNGCYIIPSTDDKTVQPDTFMCPTFIQPKQVNRLRAKTVQEILNSPTRSRLSDCSQPPTYRINKTTTTPSEVSYGQLKRIEASRLLANDLRRRLCGNATVCKAATDWQIESFWKNIYSKTTFDSIPKGNGENTSLWDTPWVACVQTNGTQICDGVIKRSDWATGDRQSLCLNTLTNSPLANSLAQDVNVCDLDAGMDQFCRTIQDARYQIFEANCLYSGQCRQKLFFYQPSTYAVDNGEFVRSTVQRFYNSTVAGACQPDQDTAQAILNNAPNLEKCAAVQLNVLADCIQIVRVIVGALVELFYYMGQLMMTVFKLMGAGKGAQENAITAEMNALLKLMQNKFRLVFEQVGDLMYKVVFEGPMGAWLMSMISAICNFLEWLFSEVVYIIMCWVQKSTVWFLKTIANPFVDILNGISIGALNYLYSDIADAIVSVETNIPCTQKTLWSCNLNFNNSDKRVTILPLPTRCWAGVEPGVSSLACTAADTCMTSDFGKIICGVCPSPATSSMIRFGCDTLTKLCTCNVFPSDVSACSSHEECTMEGGEVGCRYVDSYLQPSYGSVPCAQCPNPMCLITDGSGVGKCSCLLRPVPNQACSEPGQPVSPNAAQLCLAAVSGGGSAGTTNAYTQNYRVLTNVPCMLLNQAQSFCMQVYTSATASTPLVVGLALLHTGRRRLLAWDELINEGVVQLESNASAWNGYGEPCRSLVFANVSQLGIMDKYARGECWRWLDIGMHLTTEANMSGVNPYFLVSWHDMVSTMLDRGALVEILAKLPEVVHRLLLHTEALQPAYIMLTYWTAVLPKNVWTNQTMLNDAKQYLNNYTASTIYVENSAPSMHVPTHDFNATNVTEGPRLHMRRLLSDEEAIGIPSNRNLLAVSASTVISANPSSQTVYEWSQGPYSWPPNYIYWQGEKSCAMVSTALSVIRNGLDSTMKFYQSPAPEPTPVSWPSLPIRANLSISLPTFPKNLDLSSLTIKTITEAAEEIMSNITDQMLDKQQISSILIDAPYLKTIKGLIQCNFTRIQTCEGRHPLFASALQALAVVVGMGILGRVLEIPYIDALLVVAFVPLFMYITYGYSLTCAPLIPTCLLHDLFDIIDYILPTKLEWPEELVDFIGCHSADCMRSCVTDTTVGFRAWQDHMAWIMCEIDEGWSVAQALTFPSEDPFRLAILRKCTVQTDSMRASQRICFAVTVVRSIPFILLILIAMWLIPSAGIIGMAAAQSFVNLMFTFILYVHSDG